MTFPVNRPICQWFFRLLSLLNFIFRLVVRYKFIWRKEGSSKWWKFALLKGISPSMLNSLSFMCWSNNKTHCCHLLPPSAKDFSAIHSNTSISFFNRSSCCAFLVITEMHLQTLAHGHSLSSAVVRRGGGGGVGAGASLCGTPRTVANIISKFKSIIY